MVVGGLVQDRVGFGLDRVGDPVAVLVEVADGLVGAHHSVHRGGDVAGRGSRSDERVRGGPQDRPSRVGPGSPDALGGQRHPGRRDQAQDGSAADREGADLVGDVDRGPAFDLDELFGQPPLVDEHDAIAFHPERAPIAGGGPGGGSRYAGLGPGRAAWRPALEARRPRLRAPRPRAG